MKSGLEIVQTKWQRSVVSAVGRRPCFDRCSLLSGYPDKREPMLPIKHIPLNHYFCTSKLNLPTICRNVSFCVHQINSLPLQLFFRNRRKTKKTEHNGYSVPERYSFIGVYFYTKRTSFVPLDTTILLFGTIVCAGAFFRSQSTLADSTFYHRQMQPALQTLLCIWQARWLPSSISAPTPCSAGLS